jgi:hypothetical protein
MFGLALKTIPEGAAGGGFDGLSFPTGSPLRIVGCVDVRVNPSDVLGIKLGEAVIMRNLDGRITPTTLYWWKLLGGVAKEAAAGRRPTNTPAGPTARSLTGHALFIKHVRVAVRAGAHRAVVEPFVRARSLTAIVAQARLPGAAGVQPSPGHGGGP